MPSRDQPGSSPHTRGALPRETRPVNIVRIIPAYAGSTSKDFGTASSPGDHPRIRGEHAPAVDVDVTFQWIIPAYAGSTSGHLRRLATPEDHPRIRGEHTFAAKHPATSAGSSPHTRGAPHFPSLKKGKIRIIPAYAGSTRPTIYVGLGRRDHPRIRGEHENKIGEIYQNKGSSPHTRGAHKVLS